MQQNIDRIRKIFKTYFIPHSDFDKGFMEFQNDVIKKVKENVTSKILIGQATEETLKVMFDRYKLKSDSICKKDKIRNALNTLITDIITSIYNQLYPNSYF